MFRLDGKLEHILRRSFELVTTVSVGFKVLGMATGIVLLLGLAVILQVRARLQAELSASLEARGIAIARDLAARSADPILTDNTFSLYQLLRDTLENNPDVRYVFLLDPDGSALVHSFDQRVPPGLLAVNPIADGESCRVQIIETEEGLITDIAVPILGGRAGIARVGLSQRSLANAITEATWNLVGVTALALAFGLAIALILTRLLTRPVLELVSAAKRVEQGDLSAKARRFMNDEIGELTSAFNRMTESLQRSQADLLRRVDEIGTLNATATAISGEMNLTDIFSTPPLRKFWKC